MPTNHHYSGKKPAAAVTALNAAIISLLALVIVLLTVYLYIFFSGNDFIGKMGIELPWSASEKSTPKVIVSSSAEGEATETRATHTSETKAPPSAVSPSQNTAGENTPSDTIVEETPPEVTAQYVPADYSDDFFSRSLFIGDSIFTGLTGFEYLPQENVFAQVGLNPQSATTKEVNGYTAVQKAYAMQPDRICIMLGTNGLAYMSTEYMDEEMGELIDSLKTVCPDSELIILSIPPVTKEHEAENPEKIADIKDYNEKLRKTSDNKGCRFIDIYSILSDGSGYLSDSYAEVDGLHFLERAYGVILSKIQSELEDSQASGEAEDEAAQTVLYRKMTEEYEETVFTVNILV